MLEAISSTAISAGQAVVRSAESEMTTPAAGAQLVKVKEVGVDNTPFRVEYDPGHPAADKTGYVKLPNVNMMIEMADMREVNRSYEANLQIVKQVRSMLGMTIDLLKGA